MLGSAIQSVNRVSRDSIGRPARELRATWIVPSDFRRTQREQIWSAILHYADLDDASGHFSRAGALCGGPSLNEGPLRSRLAALSGG